MDDEAGRTPSYDIFQAKARRVLDLVCH
jgi:hypothetical protein